MFKAEQDFVFVSIQEGISQKTGKPYRMIKLANPKTFENVTLNASNPNQQLASFAQGDLVRPKLSIGEFFGRVSVSLVDLLPSTAR